MDHIIRARTERIRMLLLGCGVLRQELRSELSKKDGGLC
jgi:hypothetical protein